MLQMSGAKRSAQRGLLRPEKVRNRKCAVAGMLQRCAYAAARSAWSWKMRNALRGDLGPRWRPTRPPQAESLPHSATECLGDGGLAAQAFALFQLLQQRRLQGLRIEIHFAGGNFRFRRAFEAQLADT